MCTDVPTRLVSHNLHPGWPRLCKHRAWRHWRPTVCWPAARLEPLEASKLYTWVGQSQRQGASEGPAAGDVRGRGGHLRHWLEPGDRDTPHTQVRAFSWRCCYILLLLLRCRRLSLGSISSAITLISHLHITHMQLQALRATLGRARAKMISRQNKSSEDRERMCDAYWWVCFLS